MIQAVGFCQGLSFLEGLRKCWCSFKTTQKGVTSKRTDPCKPQSKPG